MKYLDRNLTLKEGHKWVANRQGTGASEMDAFIGGALYAEKKLSKSSRIDQIDFPKLKDIEEAFSIILHAIDEIEANTPLLSIDELSSIKHLSIKYLKELEAHKKEVFASIQSELNSDKIIGK